jgi:hypothetical protein
MLALLTQLKVFKHVGRMARRRTTLSNRARDMNEDRRTLYRHHHAIRLYLGITPWGPKARGIPREEIAAAARAWTGCRSSRVSCRKIWVPSIACRRSPKRAGPVVEPVL